MVVSDIFFFSPLFGEMIQFDVHIFQMGWFNHQLVTFFFQTSLVDVNAACPILSGQVLTDWLDEEDVMTSLESEAVMEGLGKQIGQGSLNYTPVN